MSLQMWILIQTMILSVLNSVSSTDYCYTTDPSPYRRYASYTPYYDSHGVPDAAEQMIPGCSAVYFYLHQRHGVRHPDSSVQQYQHTVMPALRDAVLHNHRHLGKGSLCEEDLSRLEQWMPRTDADDVYDLAETGWQELREIAERYSIRYPSLLGLNYTEDTRDHYYMRHTEKVRMRDSTRAFAQGLFGFYDGVDMAVVAEEDDDLLRFDVNCDKFQETVNNQPNIEWETFIQGPEVAAMIAHVETRLGFNAGELGWEVVYNIYENCRFDHGVYEDSPWCAALTRPDLEVINYSDDLEAYWKRTYGHDINYEMSCEISVDMMQRFIYATTTGAPGTAMHFAHGTTYYSWSARSGLYNDTVPPTASNYEDRHNRLWDNTDQMPLATNLAYVLHTCDGSGEHAPGYYVRFHYMEDVAVMPGCNDVMCPYDQFAAYWDTIAMECDFDALCAYP